MRNPHVDAVIQPLLLSDRIVTCSVFELEILFSARNAADFAATRFDLRAYRRFDVTQLDFDRATDVLGLLAERGQHRAGNLSDLLLSAVAERNNLTVLHYDAHFELISAVTGQPAEWVVPRGSVP
jgi:predicted nucleic acid-binding protein